MDEHWIGPRSAHFDSAKAADVLKLKMPCAIFLRRYRTSMEGRARRRIEQSTVTSQVIVNLRHLYTFGEAARLESISAAARHIHLSQPAVTQAVASLDDLGVVVATRRSAPEWNRTTLAMLAKTGAPVSAADARTIARYLQRHFGLSRSPQNE
jgi:hypothetical protein